MSRPAIMPKSYVFNRVMGLDSAITDNATKNDKMSWLIMICWGVKYFQVEHTGQSQQHCRLGRRISVLGSDPLDRQRW